MKRVELYQQAVIDAWRKREEQDLIYKDMLDRLFKLKVQNILRSNWGRVFNIKGNEYVLGYGEWNTYEAPLKVSLTLYFIELPDRFERMKKLTDAEKDIVKKLKKKVKNQLEKQLSWRKHYYFAFDKSDISRFQDARYHLTNKLEFYKAGTWSWTFDQLMGEHFATSGMDLTSTITIFSDKTDEDDD